MAMTNPKKQLAHDLSEFFSRYIAILMSAREFILRVATVAQRNDEDPYVSTRQVAEFIARHQPAAYLKTFGNDAEAHKLKVWRLKTLLYNASFLGAYGALGIKAVRGKGLTMDVGRRGRLRVIRGGKS